jgi:Leucine-rich repeat (LRR) protein/Tol biopolymer transport system component
MSLRLFVRLIAATFGVLLVATAGAQIPQTERDALIALYGSTNGANWNNNTGWNGAPGTECTWFGVTCDDASSSVTNIALYSNNLTGTLSPIGALANLQNFDVDDNKLGGPLPSLAGLTALEGFSAQGNYTQDGNKFSGSIPSLAGLTALKGIYFRFANLSGSVPSLSGLTSLQFFDFGDNQLTGSIPSLQGLASLQGFSVEGNQLTGTIPALDGLPSLNYINVQYNALSGRIPALAGLPALQVFAAAANYLTGPIPPLSGLSALYDFDVGFNDLTGTIPALDGLAQLQSFHVDFNQLNGSLPVLTGLSSLQTFAAQVNQLTGTIPSLSGLPKLVDFEVFDNQLTGPIPALSGLNSLAIFSAGANQLSGSIPSLSGLTALIAFQVDTNQLSGSLPALSGLTALTKFTAYSNQLSGAIPALSGLTSLVTFDVDTNDLTGPIPPLSDLTALKDLEVYSNNLTGPIPSLSGLTVLETFLAQENLLSGSLPALSGSPALVFFHAEKNQLTGSLPSLSGLTALQEFQVYSNQLSGSIPLLTGLTSLVIFDVSGNRLTGNLPSLNGLSALYALRVGDNQLSGPLPQVPQPDNLAAYHSSLCPNALTPTLDPAWDAATGYSPWYDTCTYVESTNGAPTSKDSTQIVLSRDGKIKVFQSLQTDLTSNVANAGGQDIYSVSADGSPVLESLDSSGNKLIGMASLPAISPDGKVIAFLFAPAGAKNQKDLATGQMFAGAQGQAKHQVDLGMGATAANGAANGSPSLAISGDGSTLLAFCSAASNLVAGDGNGARDIFVVNPLDTSVAAQRISVDGAGLELPGDSCEPRLSGDGTRLVFSLSAPILFATPSRQIVLKELTAGKVLLTGQLLPITTDASGHGADADSSEPVINQDGSVIAFTSRADLDGIGTPVDGREVFVSLAQLGGSRLLRRARTGDGTVPDGASEHPQLSDDGTAVVMQTAATNFLQSKALAKEDVAVAPAQCGAIAITTNFFSVAALGGALCTSDGMTVNQSPSISGDGTATGFDSNAAQSNGNTNRNAYAQGIGAHTGTTGTALPNLSGDFSGQWYDPTQSGQGLVIDVANPDANNLRRMILTWFVFSNGQPTWVQGVGYPMAGTGADADTVVVQMDQVGIFQGTSFPRGGTAVTPRLWGSITLTFTDANAGTMSWRSSQTGFGSGSMPIQHFLPVSLPVNDVAGTQISSCYSGNWYNHDQPGHGFELEVLPTSPPLLAVDWFAYSPTGAPVWLHGVGAISGNTAQIDLQIIDGDGAQFPPNFNSSTITQHDWGTVKFTFADSANATMSWNSTFPGYGSGTQPLQPLSQGLLDRRGCK